MRKNMLLFLSLFLAIQMQAQESAILLRPYYGIGVSWIDLDLANGSEKYSPALGPGLELGYSIQFNTTWGYYATVTWHKPEYHRTFRNITSSVVFDNKQISMGCYYRIIDFKSSALMGYLLGFGLSYHIPSALILVEQNKQFEAIGYNNSIGFHLDSRLLFNVGAKLSVEPGLKWRYAVFKATSYGDKQNDLSQVPEDFLTLNSSGVEISCAFRYTIGRKKVR